MRLLICNWTRRKVGGTEDYLCSILPKLINFGYQLAFVSEVDSQIDRSPIDLPPGVPDWCISRLSASAVLNNIRSWKPQLIYCHGPLQARFESDLLEIAPTVYFAHNYYGTCIGGYKAHRLPTPRPCNQKFGPSCLVKYFPLRCGGRSPVTMFRIYSREKKRLENLKRYRAIVTHSDHMRREYLRHGIPENRLFSFVYEVKSSCNEEPRTNLVNIKLEMGSKSPDPDYNVTRLLFLGRMESLKGGETLIDSAAIVQKNLNKPVEVVFGGDGPDRLRWQERAGALGTVFPNLNFKFPGWLTHAQVANLLSNSNVMVVPSLWPEPFGRVGVQAGHHGLPVAAFDVGGIPEWLKHGVNGFLAPGNPPTAGGLATAILRCLDEEVTPELRAGARRLADRFSTHLHLQHLLKVFAFAATGTRT